MEANKKISGFANNGMQQFEQVIDGSSTKKHYCFTAIDGDAVITKLTNIDNSDALPYLGEGGIAYQGVNYFGRFKEIEVTGKVVIQLDQQ